MSEHRSPGTDEENPITQHEPSLRTRRLLVIAFYLSVFACLLAIWLSGTLFGNAGQVLPHWLFRGAAAHRVSILSASCICLLVWYAILRHVTGDIMAVPERYLDERQKMVRDQAHRSAFRLVKLFCCLIPLLLMAQYFLPRQPAPAPTPTPAPLVAAASMQTTILYTSVLPDPSITQRLHLVQAAQELKRSPHTSVGTFWFTSIYLKPGYQLTIHQMIIRTPPITHIPPVPPASTAEIALAVGVLLLCLYLLFSALPMSVIAWKRRL